MAAVELRGISKSFIEGSFPALKDIHLGIPDGAFASILGPSGCGKTTLLRIVAGLERPDAGEILIGGQVANRIPPRERNVAMVFQNYALYPHKRAYENIAIGLQLRGVSKERISEKVEAVANMLKIETLMDRYPKQLSGGQQQRVFLARALAQDAQLYLMDEPFAGVDATTEQAILGLLQDLRSQGRTVVAVHHDLQTVADYFDHVVLLNMRLVAAGQMQTAFTDENLQLTYGGRLTVLSQAAEALSARKPVHKD